MAVREALILLKKPSSGILMFAGLYTALVIHLSLFPYEGWRSIGIGPLEYLSGPWVPVHQTLLWTDITANVLAYIPLSFMLTVSWKPQRYPIVPACTLLVCFLLSLGLEGLQTYLPTRVPSNMDLLTNTAGAFIGITLAYVLQTFRNPENTFTTTLNNWLTHRAWLSMGLLTLWFFSLLPPLSPPFSTGLWLGNIFDLPGPQQLGTPFDLPLEFILQVESIAPHFINYCFLMCAWLLGLSQTHKAAPRFRLLLLLGFITLSVRTLDTLLTEPLEYWPHLFNLWFESNQIGVLLAFLTATGLSLRNIASHQLARLGLLHLIAGWLITLLLPGVYAPDIEEGGGSVLTLFHSLQKAGLWINELWPILALIILAFLSRPEHRFRG